VKQSQKRRKQEAFFFEKRTKKRSSGLRPCGTRALEIEAAQR